MKTNSTLNRDYLKVHCPNLNRVSKTWIEKDNIIEHPETANNRTWI